MAVGWLIFHLTDRCQLNCRHCLRDPALKPEDLDPSLIEEIIQQAVTVYDTSHIGFTGGEPTLHPQFWQIVDGIVARGLSWHVVTNGIAFETAVLRPMLADPRRRDGLTVINLSVDGADEPTHDRIRAEGSFRGMMQAISLCRHYHLPFLMQMAVNRYNAHQIERYALLASDLGAQRISYAMTQPTGTAFDAEMHLSLTQWRQVRDRIGKLQNSIRIPITATDALPTKESFYVCSAFRSEVLHINHRGLLTLCCQHSGVPGDESSADAIADLRQVSLPEAHARLLSLVLEFQQRKLEAMAAQQLEPWDQSPCNYCMKCFGKPHWREEGAAGPRAERQRWRRNPAPAPAVVSAADTARAADGSAAPKPPAGNGTRREQAQLP